MQLYACIFLDLLHRFWYIEVFISIEYNNNVLICYTQDRGGLLPKITSLNLFKMLIVHV